MYFIIKFSNKDLVNSKIVFNRPGWNGFINPKPFNMKPETNCAILPTKHECYKKNIYVKSSKLETDLSTSTTTRNESHLASKYEVFSLTHRPASLEICILVYYFIMRQKYFTHNQVNQSLY